MLSEMRSEDGEPRRGCLLTLLLLSISCLPVHVPVENGLGVLGELSCSLVQVVRLVEGNDLQFLLLRVALPSKLFTCTTFAELLT